MKHLPGKHLWPCTILLLVLLSPPASINQVVNAQSARQWPTRWQAGDTPADLTLARTLGLTDKDELGEVVGMGDFNGDRISDVLVSYKKAVPISEDRLTDRVVRYGIFFGKSAQAAPASINIDKQTPDLTLDLDSNLIGFILTAGDVNGDHIDDLMLVERVGDFGLGGARILYGSARPQSGRLDVTRQTPDLRILN